MPSLNNKKLQRNPKAGDMLFVTGGFVPHMQLKLNVWLLACMFAYYVEKKHDFRTNDERLEQVLEIQYRNELQRERVLKLEEEVLKLKLLQLGNYEVVIEDS